MSVGKGAIKKPIDIILADIKETDKPNRLREAEWKRKNPPNKTKAKDPRPADISMWQGAASGRRISPTT